MIDTASIQLSQAHETIQRLESELKAERTFGELWYFAMDEVPLDFERIVTTYPPAHWMDELLKLHRAQKR